MNFITKLFDKREKSAHNWMLIKQDFSYSNWCCNDNGGGCWNLQYLIKFLTLQHLLDSLPVIQYWSLPTHALKHGAPLQYTGRDSTLRHCRLTGGYYTCSLTHSLRSPLSRSVATLAGTPSRRRRRRRRSLVRDVSSSLATFRIRLRLSDNIHFPLEAGFRKLFYKLVRDRNLLVLVFDYWSNWYVCY